MFRSKKLLLSVITLTAIHGLVAMEENPSSPLQNMVTILPTSALAKDGYTHYGQFGLCSYKQDTYGRLFPMTAQDLNDVGITTLKKSQKLGSFVQEHHCALGNTAIGATGLGTALMQYQNGTLETPSDFAWHGAKTLLTMGLYSTLTSMMFTPNKRNCRTIFETTTPLLFAGSTITAISAYYQNKQNLAVFLFYLPVGISLAGGGAFVINDQLHKRFEKNKIPLNYTSIKLETDDLIIEGDIESARKLYEKCALCIASGNISDRNEIVEKIDTFITITYKKRQALFDGNKKRIAFFSDSTPETVQGNLNALTDMLGMKRIVIQKEKAK